MSCGAPGGAVKLALMDAPGLTGTVHVNEDAGQLAIDHDANKLPSCGTAVSVTVPPTGPLVSHPAVAAAPRVILQAMPSG